MKNIIKNKNAFALVAVLWIVMILSVILAAGARSHMLDTRLVMITGDSIRCKWACKGLIQASIAHLRQKQLLESEENIDQDKGANDDSNQLLSELLADTDNEQNSTTNPEDTNALELDGVLAEVLLIDEAGKLHLSAVTKNQLLEFDIVTEEIADAVLDWCDDDDNVRELGAESEYYLNLTRPYDIRNGTPQTIRELLLVRDVDRATLYGEDTNLNGKLDRNESDGETLEPMDNSDQSLDQGLIAYLTCYSYLNNQDSSDQKLVNINAAGKNDLKSKLSIAESHAAWIVQNRPKDGYSSIGDLINSNSPQTASQQDRNSKSARPLDLTTFREIAPKITTSDKKKILGKVNINTAGQEVLSALLEGDRQTAQEIIDFREGIGQIDNIADLLDMENMSVSTFKKLAGWITAESGVYTIRAFAQGLRSKAKYVSEAVVDINQDPAVLLYYYHGAAH